MELENILMRASFDAGPSLKGIIDYLRTCNIKGSFIFHHNLISYSMTDTTGSILNIFEINTNCIPKYEFNHDSPVVVGLDLGKLKKILSIITSKNGVRFTLFKNYPNLIIQITTPGSKELYDSNINTIEIIPTELEKMEGPEYSKPESEPNCYMNVTEFCKYCNELTKNQSEYINVRSTPTGFSFEVRSAKTVVINREIGAFSEKGNFMLKLSEKLKNMTLDDDENNDFVFKEKNEMERINIKGSFIKSLSKLNIPFKSTSVKLYKEDDLPLKLIFRNQYSSLTIFVRDMQKN